MTRPFPPSHLPPLDSVWQTQRAEWLELLAAGADRIRHCLEQLDESQLWWRPFPNAPSIGNQILHVCGNLNQWVVCGVPGHACERDRTGEFRADASASREELEARLRTTLEAVQRVLNRLRGDDLPQRRRIQDFEVTVAGALTHSLPHFVGHAHQITLLTRLQLGDRYRLHWSPDNDRGRVPV